MVERDGDVVTKVVPNVRKGTLEPIIEANVEKGSTVHIDELASYGGRWSPARSATSRGVVVTPWP
jgi:transposase-like protein